MPLYMQGIDQSSIKANPFQSYHAEVCTLFGSLSKFNSAITDYIRHAVTDDVLRVGIAECERRSDCAASESMAEHISRLRGYLDDPTAELLRELAEVIQVRARLRRDDAGRRWLVVSSGLGVEAEYPM